MLPTLFSPSTWAIRVSISVWISVIRPLCGSTTSNWTSSTTGGPLRWWTCSGRHFPEWFVPCGKTFTTWWDRFPWILHFIVHQSCLCNIIFEIAGRLRRSVQKGGYTPYQADAVISDPQCSPTSGIGVRCRWQENWPRRQRSRSSERLQLRPGKCRFCGSVEFHHWRKRFYSISLLRHRVVIGWDSTTLPKADTNEVGTRICASSPKKSQEIPRCSPDRSIEIPSP